MNSTVKPWWRQATALVTVSTGGVVTGLTFAPGTAATVTSPSGLPPVHLMALDKAATAEPGPGLRSADEQLRSAVVNVARYYLRLARTRTPDQLNALIWGADSLDGADHGPSCAAFASLTLELGAQAVGQESWVSGGGSYPWPVHSWVDARVDENPDSPQVTSVVRDAESHGRWHALGDGYRPQPGDWVVFDQHVEVVTGHSGGGLDTIGADSLPGYTINAHTFDGSPADHGIAGFIDNGNLAPARSEKPSAPQTPTARKARETGTASTARTAPAARHTPTAQKAQAAIPGSVAPQPVARAAAASASKPQSGPSAAIPGLITGNPITGIPTASSPATGTPGGGKYTKHTPPASSSAPAARSQREFIGAVASGAMAAQRRYGVPAAVTIAQAIEESDWGASELASRDHNLFGIKGTGPAGATTYPTREFIDGRWETVDAGFRSYHNIAESISDHAELLATSGYYTRAMADRALPDAFANDLTGVYATDPDYGSNLIALMRLYNLYRYDATPATAPAQANTATPPASKNAGTAPAQKNAGTPSAKKNAAAPSARKPAAQQNTRKTPARGAARIPGLRPVSVTTAERYRTPLPAATAAAYFTTARTPVGRAEQLYRDVAGRQGISWKLLAACDWMQCQSDPRYSPVHGERLGTVNWDGSVYATRSEALARCAADMIELADAVYGIDLTVPRLMPVRSLAEVFAAFRWGGLLVSHGVSAMEFPYSVAGLTDGHTRMHWPVIDEKTVPDRPGGKFRQPFGAVPVVLSLKYPATV